MQVNLNRSFPGAYPEVPEDRAVWVAISRLQQLSAAIEVGVDTVELTLDEKVILDYD